MNVVYDLDAYSFSSRGGVVRIFDHLLDRFAGRNDFQGYLYVSNPPTRMPPMSDRVRARGLPALPHSLRGLKAAQVLHETADQWVWKRAAPQLYHPTFYPTHNRFRTLPTVVNIYDLIHERVPDADDMPNHEAFLAVKKRAIERADQLVCISESTRTDLLAYYEVDERKTCVLPLGHEPAFHPVNVEPTARPFVLYVGSRQRYKNFHRFVRAFAHWSGGRDFDLVVAGPPAGTIDHMLLDLEGCADRVRFVGSTSDEELNRLYNQARFFVYPSLWEGFGIPLLEAMAAGCPCCISEIAPFREVAEEHAVYFDPMDTGAIATAFDEAAGIRDTPGRLDAARARAGTFSWSRFTDGVWNIYEKLAGIN